MKFSVMPPVSALLSVSLAAITVAALAQSPSTPAAPVVSASYGKLPLSFEANRGQADPGIEFLSRGNGYSLFLTDSAAVLTLGHAPACGAGIAKPPVKSSACATPGGSRPEVVRMTLAGASSVSHEKASGEAELPGKVNYFIGNNPSQWRTGLPTYAKVRYRNLYPGIDLVYYGNQSQLEYDFDVSPGASPAPIRLKFDGQKRLRIAANGDLILEGKQGFATLQKPIVYQEKSGRREPVSGSFRLLARNTVTFALGDYDRSKPLVIDPVLTYSTFLGGSTGVSRGGGIAVDSSGNAYVTGSTTATDFPVTSGAFQTVNQASSGWQNVFISKLDPSGTTLIYSTYLGGSGMFGGGDVGTAIAVDPSGNAFVTGYTQSANFPVTSGAFQATPPKTNGPQSSFVTKLDPTGSTLLYSTYLGGNSQDFATGIALDASGDAYVAGATSSTTFPVTSGAYQMKNKASGGANESVFVTKLNPTGTALVYSTYLGGSGVGFNGDWGYGIAVDADADAYVTGYAGSSDFPVTAGAFQTATGGRTAGNAFLTKFNSTGTALVYSTYLGGSGNDGVNPDYGNGVAVDGAGNAYVTGFAISKNFPVTPGAFQTVNNEVTGLGNAFISKFNPTGSALVYSTYLGGSGYQRTGDSGAQIVVDEVGDAYVTGSTYSTDFPVASGAIQIVNNAAKAHGENAFVSKLNATGTELLYSTYLGGSVGDYGTGIAIDSARNAYVAGTTQSTDFPVTTGALQTVNAGTKAFLSRLAIPTVGPPVNLTPIETLPGASTTYGNPQTVFTLGVRLTDSEGNGIAGSTVDFAGVGLSFTPSSATTDATGAAYVTATPTTAGSLQATASVAGVSATAVFPINVVPAPLTVTIHGPTYQRTYGSANPVFPNVVTGLIGSETVTVNTTTTATPFSPVGSYPVSATISGPDAAHYALTVIGATLQVNKASLHIVASAIADTYGNTPPQPTAYYLTGFLNGDTVSVVSGAPILSTSVTSTTPVGFYPIGVQVGSLTATNYNFLTTSNGPGYVGVYKAPIAVRANTVTMTQGGPVPPLTYTLTGFVNGEGAGVVSGAPILISSATSASTPGTYGIQVLAGTLSAANYAFFPVVHSGVVHVVK